MAKRQPDAGIADCYMLKDLEQVKVLADALRVRILELLGPRPRTTKQVAELLGEKPTRLYHHVDALEKAGLIRLADTRQVRGTVEKYYRAVARTFRADPSLFAPTPQDTERRETLASVVDTILTNTGEELRAILAAGHDLSADDKEGLVSYFEARGSERDMFEFRDKLVALLKEFEAKACCDLGEEYERRFRFTLAYFPLDLEERSKKQSS